MLRYLLESDAQITQSGRRSLWYEIEVITAGPFVSSTSQGDLVVSVVRPGHLVLASFFKLDEKGEPNFLVEAWRKLWKLSAVNGWPNRFFSFQDGIDYLADVGNTAHIALGASDVSQVPLEITVVVQGFAAGSALILSSPVMTGSYVRYGSEVALVLRDVPRTLALCGPRI